MTKLPCNIVKDLLPLYEDNVCSEQSKDSVEEHLIICEDCRNEYDSIHEKLPKISEAEDTTIKSDIENIKGIRKKINRKLTARQIIITGIIILVLIATTSSFQSLLAPLFFVSTDDVHVTELYQLEDGDIYCTLKSDKKIKHVSEDFVVASEKDSEGKYNNGWTEISFYSDILHRLGNGIFVPSQSQTFVLARKNEDISFENKTITQKSKSIYYVGTGNKQKLIWKEGQTLLPAPQDIEDRVASERTKDAASRQDSGTFEDEQSNDLLLSNFVNEN